VVVVVVTVVGLPVRRFGVPLLATRGKLIIEFHLLASQAKLGLGEVVGA